MKVKKVKTLVLSHTSDLVGGAERSMLDVFDYWEKNNNIEPVFVIREPLGSLVPELKRRGWKYYSVKFTFWSWPNPPTKPEDIFHAFAENTKAVKKIEQIIKDIEPDVVMTNTIISPWAALAAHYQNVPHIWFVREYGDLDHGRKFDIPHEQIYQDVGNLSNLVVANSKTMAEHITKFVPTAKVATLYNPFNIQKLKERSKAKIQNPFRHDGLKLVMTSNISRTKGQLEAVQAVGQLNQDGIPAEICILGKNVDKPYYEEIEEVIKQYDIADKVHFAGLQPNALAYVNAADVGIVASRKEAFGRTTFEYIAIGKPVVGADSGATPEMVENNVNGFLFAPGDSKSLAGALKNYVNDNSLLAKHGAASAKKAAAMMAGKNNIDNLYVKVKAVAEGKGEPKAEPINYLKQWQQIQQNVRKFTEKSGRTSLRRKARIRLRQMAKDNYYRAKKIRSRLSR